MSSSPYSVTRSLKKLSVSKFLEVTPDPPCSRGWAAPCPASLTPQNVVLIVLICLSSHLDQTRQTFSHYKFMHQILVILAGNRERERERKKKKTSNTVPVHPPSRLFCENYVQASDARPRPLKIALLYSNEAS